MTAGLLAAALPDLQVQSAGLSALIGMPADGTAIRLMHARGLDISAHRAQQVNRALCTHADLVLVMDTDQKQRMEEMYPQACGRVFRVAEHGKLDIPDPYRQPENAFRDSLALIDVGVSAWLQRIRRL